MEDGIWGDIMVGRVEDKTTDIMSSLSRDFENLDIDNDNESTFESADKKVGIRTSSRINIGSLLGAN